MDIVEARHLKAEVLDDLRAFVTSHEYVDDRRGGEASSLGLGAALGVTRAPEGDFRVAIRIQSGLLLRSLYAREARRRFGPSVDIRWVGRGRPSAPATDREWNQKPSGPLLMGVSIGADGATGTLGAFVRVGRQVALLSNRHVLDPSFSGSKLGVEQPGKADGGGDEIATLRASHPISLTEPNKVDAAVAVLNEGVKYEASELRGFGVLDPVPGDPIANHASGKVLVGKIGRTSGLTTGFIRTVEVDGVEVDYGSGRKAIFDGQVEIVGHYFKRPFTEIGDSGSLIFDLGDHRPVALHFAAGEPDPPAAPSVAYATPIGDVLQLLQAEFIVGK